MVPSLLGLLFAALAAAAPFNGHNATSLSNHQSSLTLLYQNNLNETDDVNHISTILLDPMSSSEAESACASLGESLLSASTIKDYAADISKSLAYVQYSSHSHEEAQYWIEDGVLTVESGRLYTHSNRGYGRQLRPLCTQSSEASDATTAVATSQNEIRIPVQDNTYVGFRNKKSFRFQGMRYASQPKRFTYSKVYDVSGETIDATEYGAACLQPGAAFEESEDCLFLNIQTPYIPKAGSKKDLRPVMFWIHGGGFMTGRGSDPGTDGGNLASREDIVEVSINYRLGALGFLTIPGTDLTGNYGISDQITALEVGHRVLRVVS